MLKTLVALTIIISGLWIATTASVVFSQETTDTQPGTQLTLEELNTRIENFKAVPDLDESLKSSIQQLYERARQQLESANQSDAELKKYQDLGNQAQTLLESARSELAASSEETLVKIPSESSEAQLQELLRQKNVDLTAAREKSKEAANEMARRQTRLVELPELIAKSEKRLDEIKAQLASEAPPGENSLLTQARKTQLTAEQQNLQNQAAAYQSEKAAYASTADLPPLLDQLSQRKTKGLESEVGAIKARITRIRENEIDKRIRVATENLAAAPDALKPLAQANATLAEQLKKTSERIAEVTLIEQQVEDARIELSKRYETTKVRVEAIGLSDTLGIMLRQNKAEVEKLQLKFRVNPNLRDEVSQNRADSFRSEDNAEDLSNLEKVYESVAMQLNLTGTDKDDLKAPAIDLLDQQKKIYVRLSELQNDAFNALFGLLTEKRRFAILSSEYSSYIDEHVLWVRSAKFIGASEHQTIVRRLGGEPNANDVVVYKSDLSATLEAARGLADPERWKEVGRAFIQGSKNRLSFALIIIWGLVLMFVSQNKLKKNILASAKKASRRSCREITPSVTTLLETLFLSFLWPGVFMTIGWLMRSDLMVEPFPYALGTGMISVGLMTAPLEFMRHVCRQDGLAQAHLDWPDPVRRTIRSNIHWLTLAGAPLLLVIVTLNNYGEEEWNNSLGRICMIILLALAAVFVYRVLRPNSPLFRTSQDRDSRFYKLRYFRFGVIQIGLIGMIVFALAGYYYTTYQLGINLFQTIALSIALVTLYCVALRFLLVRRRKLRYEQLVTQRENLQKQQRLAAEAAAEGTAPPKNLESQYVDIQTELGTDINSVSRQAQELTGVIFVAMTLVFLWQIWQDVLPATKLLDTVELWPVAVGDKGETDIVSLRDLLISAGLFLITFFSVRNIPGMLELLLLKQLPLDAGSRYAITTIFRYFIVVFGVILALNFLKVPWSKYSWLVAAISLGLGFGLQEIVANFVSGLIILLERPVRVGDIVTIDGVTGVVSRIQMRATTVTNFDNQELVVPNKDLVTNKLLNWTLSSVVNRVRVSVGVAYGTDIERVQKLIVSVAKANPDVLNEPEPVVSFEEFGDSSLNFTLRCCIAGVERRLHVIHSLNLGINQTFNREGIVIPFPQRDLHMISPPEKS